ncbi:hypothetical protein MKX08_007304 [Trichoderma sp. CBMAI-0020]|nr:hypothetical protein MKX08_007304 [Trichoderma sp. CBMAI-0020]
MGQFQLNNGVLEYLRQNWAANAPKYLGDAKYYTEFLRYIQEHVDTRALPILSSSSCLVQSAIQDTYVGDFLDMVHKAAAKPSSQRLNTSELWEELLPRFISMPNGHVVKTARALGLAQPLSQGYLDRPWIRIKDDKTWLNTQYLLLDRTCENP